MILMRQQQIGKNSSKSSIISIIALIFLLFLVACLGLLVEVINLDRQSLDFLAFSQLHLSNKLGNDQIDHCIGKDLISELIDFSIGCDYSQQFFALLKFVLIEAPEYSCDEGEGSILKCNIVIKGCYYLRLQFNNLLLADRSLAPCDHRADFRRINLIHFASDEQGGQCDMLITLLCNVDGLRRQLCEVGDGEILRILGDLLVIGEDPLDGQFSILIVSGFNGVGGGVGGIGEARQRCCLLENLGRSGLDVVGQLHLHFLFLYSKYYIEDHCRRVCVTDFGRFHKNNRRLKYAIKQLTNLDIRRQLEKKGECSKEIVIN